jgi:hypothetical protein
MDSLDLFDRGPGRPRGTYGEVREALVTAWREGPAPVREAAQRACVGHAVARYTASRMADEGQLCVVVGRRPAVMALADDERVCPLPQGGGAEPMSAERVRDELHRLGAAFWGTEADL